MTELRLCSFLKGPSSLGESQRKVEEKARRKPGMVVHALISAFWRQRQEDIYEFEASLVYTGSCEFQDYIERLWSQKAKTKPKTVRDTVACM